MGLEKRPLFPCSCLLRPDEGDARVMGHSIINDQMGVKSVLGVVPQEIALYEDLTARENLIFWGKMYGLRGGALKKRVVEVLDVIGLRDRASCLGNGWLQKYQRSRLWAGISFNPGWGAGWVCCLIFHPGCVAVECS